MIRKRSERKGRFELDNNTASYDKIADRWDEIRRKKPIDPCIVALARRLPVNASILDVGCGTGYPIDVFLADKGFCITGIDPSENMLHKAISLKLPGAAFHCTDLFGFEPNETYDAVIAFDSIFHIPFDRQKDIYPKISALLKPKGLFLFTHGKRSGAVHGTMFGESFSYGALDTEILKHALTDSGLDIVAFHEDYQDPITGSRDVLIVARKRE